MQRRVWDRRSGFRHVFISKKETGSGERNMLYTYPHYYKKFHCTASECEDTCCAGWEIMIDKNRWRNIRKQRDRSGTGFTIQSIGGKVLSVSIIIVVRF